MNDFNLKRSFGDHEIYFESGKLAKQANGSVLVRSKNTLLLVNVTMGKDVEEDPGFFPLSVHYIEKYYSIGKIPPTFGKREGKPSNYAVLLSRLTDRAIRPLFPEGFRSEVQVIGTPLSIDLEFPLEVLFILGSSLALCISDIPFHNPVGAVCVVLKDNQLLFNPPQELILQGDCNFIIAGNEEGITMIEGEANLLEDHVVSQAIKAAHKIIKEQIEFQKEFITHIQKPKITPTLFSRDNAIDESVAQWMKHDIETMLSLNKVDREKKRQELLKHLKTKVIEMDAELKFPFYKEAFADLEYTLTRNRLFESNIRVDGRTPEEIRPINIEVGLLPMTHGSACFTRGETQALGVLTLGLLSASSRVDELEMPKTHQNFMLHYNFPGFSVGEVGRVTSPGRREIGHGNLAERALNAVLPKSDEFTYTVRIVSEILESNGSSSMATVCAGCLALMDGGVPLKASVAGIAMGLMFNEDKSDYKILTDIQGLEDHYGDIDFKIAGTETAISAFQLDIKMDALKLSLLDELLERAKKARIHILSQMNLVLSSPRKQLASHAPKCFKIKGNPDNIRILIGPNGKTIKALIEKYQVEIDVQDNGEVFVFTSNVEKGEILQKQIAYMIQDFTVGDIIEGTVKRITNFGAFIEIFPGKEGLCHISEIANTRIKKVEDHLKIGELVKVKIIAIDSNDRIDFSMKKV